jgi:hypothetical protein
MITDQVSGTIPGGDQLFPWCAKITGTVKLAGASTRLPHTKSTDLILLLSIPTEARISQKASVPLRRSFRHSRKFDDQKDNGCDDTGRLVV